MKKRVGFVLSILIFTITLCTQAYGLGKVYDVIPDKLPVRNQLHLAMQALYGIEAHYGDQIISESEFLSKDAALSKHHALWKAATELCLKEPSKCAILNLPLELIYGDTLRQKKILTSDATRFPSNAYALAAIVAEERLILKQLTAQNAYGKLVASSMGGGKSMTCSLVAVATGGGAQCEALNIMEEGIDPVASGAGGNSVTPPETIGPELFDHSSFATCPINVKLMGGFGGGDDPAGDPPSDDSPPPEDGGDDNGGNDDGGDDNDDDGGDDSSDDGGNDYNYDDDPGNDSEGNDSFGGNGAIELPGGVTIDLESSSVQIEGLPFEFGMLPGISLPGEDKQEMELYGGPTSPWQETNGGYGGAIIFRFRPTDDSPGFGSICGGATSALSICFPDGSGSNLNDSLEDCMAGPIECNKGNMDDFTIVASSPDCEDFLFDDGGIINPGPFGGEGGGGDGGDDSCKSPMPIKPGSECCKKNPMYPGCGDPAYLGNALISTPATSTWAKATKMAPRTKAYKNH